MLKNKLLFLLLLIWAVACNTSSKKDGSKEFTEAETKIVEEIDKVIHDLPPPSDVPFLVQASGADFNKSLVNPLDKVSAYESSLDKSALNLGVYASDIGYLVSYEQAQDALKYLDASKRLADKIGVASVFDVNLMKRFENNLSKKDSLSAIVNEAVAVAERRLEGGERLSMAALVLAGSFIEGLYISCSVIETYPENLPAETRNLILEPLIKIVLDQKLALLDLIALLKDLQQDEIISSTISELNILRYLYQDLAEVEVQIAENKGDFVLKSSVLRDITTEVKRIRGDFTK